MNSTPNPKPAHVATLAPIQLDRDASRPLHQQLYDSIRLAILQRRFEPGVRLPSTRRMALTLGVSRNTVMNAIEQLYAEGYLESRVGAGTYVTDRLPDELLKAINQDALTAAAASADVPRTLARRGQILNRAWPSGTLLQPGSDAIVFHPGLVALDAFPFDLWAKLQRRYCREAATGLAGQQLNPAGFLPLRRHIASFLKASRAIECDPEQIIITSGSQEALYLAAQVLLDHGDEALVEEPGYNGSNMAVVASDGVVTPLPVDDEGMAIQLAPPQARVAFITPSHQFPLGVTMSLKRRLELITWAKTHDGWIVEDDYDSLYRYHGQPLAALHGLDQQQRVLYVGTFSKILFSGLRLGFIVVPADIVNAFLAMRACIDLSPPFGPQVVLSHFIADGHLARHLRRMLQLYTERRDFFLAAAAKWLGSQMSLGPSDSGMHISALFAADIDDEAVWAAARRRRVLLAPLSRQFYGPPTLSGLTFGFANLRSEQMEVGLQRVAQAIAEVTQGK